MFSDVYFAGVLANAKMVFKKKFPILYNSLENREFKCRICKRAFTNFFEHFAEHFDILAIETIVLNYYNTCLDFIEPIEDGRGVDEYQSDTGLPEGGLGNGGTQRR